MPPLSDLMAVATGGAVGSVLRYLLAVLSARLTGGSSLAGTLAANLLGCFAIGLLAASVANYPDWLSHRTVIGLRVGVLGGLTTFSTFAAESILLADQGRLPWMALYVGISVGLGLLAVWAGMHLVDSRGVH
ncbi:MAG: fluoride efflux transporter CrcB [Planctomycetaceae bacterium]